MITEDSYMIPVIFHNLNDYKSQLIMKYVTREYAPKSISVIPTTSEIFLRFQIGTLRFLTVCNFLPTASLDTLLHSLAANDRDKFSHTARYYPDSALVFAEVNYPYEYMDGRDKFLLTELPLIDAFYSSLSEETIIPEVYERDQNVWREFNIENMQQYHDHYLILDVLLLADGCEHFRQTCMLDYGLNPEADGCEHFRQTCILDYGLNPEHYYTLHNSHSMRVSNLPDRNCTYLPTVKSSFLSRTLFVAELAS